MQTLTNDSLLENLKSTFSEEILNSSVDFDILSIEVTPEKTKTVIEYLKNTLEFTFLTDLCGINYPDNEGKELGVIYLLANLPQNIKIRIKAFMPKVKADIESIEDLFAAANWMERETFDFFGIRFSNHSNLTRILNVDYMSIYPLLKEYPLEDTTRTDKDDSFFGR